MSGVEDLTQRWFSDTDIKVEAIRHRWMPSLMVLRAEIQQATNRQPVAVMLPAELAPDVYPDGDGFHQPSTFLGLPVIWGATGALVYTP